MPHEHLACPPHWTKLPWRMRTNLSHAYRDRDYAAHQIALDAALAWYAHNDITTAPVSRGGETTTMIDTGSVLGGAE